MSWVVVDRSTGKAIGELSDKRNADRVNRDRYEVVPITQWLQQVNRKARAATTSNESETQDLK